MEFAENLTKKKKKLLE